MYLQHLAQFLIRSFMPVTISTDSDSSRREIVTVHGMVRFSLWEKQRRLGGSSKGDWDQKRMDREAEVLTIRSLLRGYGFFFFFLIEIGMTCFAIDGGSIKDKKGMRFGDEQVTRGTEGRQGGFRLVRSLITIGSQGPLFLVFLCMPHVAREY